MNKRCVLSFVALAIFLSRTGIAAEPDLTAQKCYEAGLTLQKQGKQPEAYAQFMLACKKDPANAIYSWAAATSAGSRTVALLNAENAWRRGLKRPPVLYFRTALLEHANKQDALCYALAGYNEMPDSFKTPEVRGDIFFRFDQFDSALSLWEPLFAKKPSPQLCLQVAMAYNGKGDFQKAGQVLKAARSKQMLDRAGYSALASLFAFEFAYKSIDTVYHELYTKGLFNDTSQLEYADFLLAQERYDVANKILDKIKMPAPGKDDAGMNFQARTRLYLVYFMNKQPDKIRELASGVPKTARFRKPEQVYAEAAADGEIGLKKILEKIEVSRKALPYSAAVDLVYARVGAACGNSEAALAVYGSLPANYGRSPRALVERAILLDKTGKDDEALQLIDGLHGRALYTKQSLELFRDIALKKRLVEKSRAAQALLEKLYPHDSSVLLVKGTLALSQGNADTALSVFSALAKTYPAEDRFEVLRISTYLAKKDFESVIRECKESKASRVMLAPLHAKALECSGRVEEARQVFEKALKETKSQGLLLEYASFLLASKQPARAVPVFEELISESKKDPKTDKTALAGLYNNLAWSCISSADCPQKVLLESARRAYDLAPDNLHIIDTYSQALLKIGRYDDCISLLQYNPLAIKEPQLQFWLGTAFEKKQKRYDACSAYERACAAADSSLKKLPITFDKAELAARIGNLKAGR